MTHSILHFEGPVLVATEEQNRTKGTSREYSEISLAIKQKYRGLALWLT